MNLHAVLATRTQEGNLARVGLLGAGKFGTTFLAEARRTNGLHIWS